LDAHSSASAQTHSALPENNIVDTSSTPSSSAQKPANHHLRFHLPHVHLAHVFGNDWFALKAEAFARFFGTPIFLVGQTAIVTVWIIMNVLALTARWRFDEYPFILLNLAFSLQAAYAAPLILLAQTRQADRDKAHSEADAAHREDLARASMERQALAATQTATLVELMDQNTKLTEMTNQLSTRIEQLTAEMHSCVVQKRPSAEDPSAPKPAAS